MTYSLTCGARSASAARRRFLRAGQALGLVSGLLLVGAAHAQVGSPTFTSRQFAAQVFRYDPPQREGVTAAKFAYAKRILAEIKVGVHQDTARLNVADYWNITSAFVALHEPKSAIELAFKKAIALDAAAVCSYLHALGPNGLDKRIPEIFLPFYQACLQAPASPPSRAPAPLDPALDPKLVGLLTRVQRQDGQFRATPPVDWARQRPLDTQNQRLIDSLYQRHHAYIGQALVGKSLAHVMWAVVQHADLGMMERYLPVVQQAVQQQQLAVAPLKMLLDRIYTLKYGQQLFGSQVGVPLADEARRSEVVKRYALE